MLSYGILTKNFSPFSQHISSDNENIALTFTQSVIKRNHTFFFRLFEYVPSFQLLLFEIFLTKNLNQVSL